MSFSSRTGDRAGPLNAHPHPQPASVQPQSLLFRLPSELRVRVYEECFRTSFVAVLCFQRHAQAKIVPINPEVIRPGLSLFLVCQLMYIEALEAFWNMTELSITSGYFADQAPRLIANIYPRSGHADRKVRLARYFFPGQLRNPAYERSENGDYATGADVLAAMPNLHSVVIGTGWEILSDETDADRIEKEAVHATLLERMLRRETSRLAHVKHVCLWFGWPKRNSKMDSMPEHFRVHRVVYTQDSGRTKYRIIDETPGGEAKEQQVRPCPHCFDAMIPWEGDADPYSPS